VTYLYLKLFFFIDFKDRFYWQSLDPINLSEGLFAISNVISIARLTFYLPISQQLGPLQITLGKMINVKFKLYSCRFRIYLRFV
jgi:hypothetical protein